MKAIITKTSDWSGKEEIKELYSLNDLYDIQQKYHNDLIISFIDNDNINIEVYDTWRE